MPASGPDASGFMLDQGPGAEMPCAPTHSQTPPGEKQDLAAIDPITLATVWYSFQSLCREMRDLVTRTSQSYLISTLKDLSVGVWLADGSAVAVPEGLPSQFLGTSFSIKDLREMFEGDIHPG